MALSARSSEAIPVVVSPAAAAARPRPQSRTISSNSGSFLPSTNASLPHTRSSANARGTQRLSSHLRRFICGCGVFYLAMVWWYSSTWSSLSTQPTPASTTAAMDALGVIESQESAQLLQPTPQVLVARDGRNAQEVGRQPQPELEPIVESEEAEQHRVRHEDTAIIPEEPEAEPKRIVGPSTVTKEPGREGSAQPAATTEPSATPYVFLDEIHQQLNPKPPAAQLTTAQADGKSLKALSPKEAFRARLAQGKALSARQAMALQALDQAARIAKQRDEEEKAKTLDPKAVALIEEAERHALTVKHMPRGETKRRRLKCIGWRATDNCDPDGQRRPALDRSCVRFVDPSQSGYCEVEDRDSGERFRVMTRQCDSLHPQARFRCFESWDFSNFAVLANNVTKDAIAKNAEALALAAAKPSAQASGDTATESNGILIVIYPKLIPSAFAIVRTLRSQNCSLPIEFWYRTDELSLDHPTLHAIEKQYGPVTFRAIEDQRATGFATKISAIKHSEFDNLLFLDADNFPVKDPTYLFELPEFKEHGAVFWPDFWHPDHTIFNIHARSLLWQLVDMDFVDMFEQESGQLLLNKKRNAVALELMQFYTFHRPNHFDKFRLAHGDKDLFRLAWLKTNTSFHFVQFPPGVAGKLQNETFCGMTMVQRDPRGDVIFLHRNAKKLTGRKFSSGPGNEELAQANGNGGAGTLLATAQLRLKQSMEAGDPAVWTHMLLFKPTSRRKDFVIDIFEGAPDFPQGQWCYGKKTLATPHFNVFAFEDLPFTQLETSIRAHAVEATDMVRASKLKQQQAAGVVPPGAV